MASLLVTLATWGAFFALFWYGAHQRFYPPGDWIGALIVSLGFALGIGALRKAHLEKRDARLLARAGGDLRDGERVAIAGTLEPEGAALHAPLSGAECAGCGGARQRRVPPGPAAPRRQPREARFERRHPADEGARRGDVEMVKVLLAQHADPAIRDAHGKTAIAYAAEGGHEEVVQLLRAAPPKPGW